MRDARIHDQFSTYLLPDPLCVRKGAGMGAGDTARGVAGPQGRLNVESRYRTIDPDLDTNVTAFGRCQPSHSRQGPLDPRGHGGQLLDTHR